MNNLTPLNANSQIISGVANPSAGTDAITTSSGDSRYIENTDDLSVFSVPTGALDMNSHKITGLADATDDADAINR